MRRPCSNNLSPSTTVAQPMTSAKATLDLLLFRTQPTRAACLNGYRSYSQRQGPVAATKPVVLADPRIDSVDNGGLMIFTHC